MKLQTLLALPPALLLCSFSIAIELQWPHNLPRHLKYFPTDEQHVRRSLEIRERLKRERPIGIRKMSLNEEEMFMLEDWIFASDGPIERDRLEQPSNLTGLLQSPLRPHRDGPPPESLLGFITKRALRKRDFACPLGTAACTSLGASDSCCGVNENCIRIPDTGFGSVGCCPRGQICAGTIQCNTANGYSSCPDSANGGCCLPGFACQGIGCVVSSTSTVLVQPSVSSVTAQSSTAMIVTPATSRSSSTLTMTQAPSPTSVYTCSRGWFSCAASLGGGCCQSGRTCATGASCLGSDPAGVSTLAPSAPVRPTSNAAASSNSLTSSLPGESQCPVGFYVCAAYYPSGCCRVGLDCQTTGGCSQIGSLTIVNTNGVVVVGPSGATVATTASPQQGTCPSSWYSCAANLGGNCCPSGYACGEQCTATAGSSVSPKVAPNAAILPSTASLWALVSTAFSTGIAMIIL